MRLLDKGFIDLVAEPDRVMFRAVPDARRIVTASIIGLLLPLLAIVPLAVVDGDRELALLVGIGFYGPAVLLGVFALWPFVRSRRGGLVFILPRGRREVLVTREPSFFRHGLFLRHELTKQSFVKKEVSNESLVDGHCYLRGPGFDYPVGHDIGLFNDLMRFSIDGTPLPAQCGPDPLRTAPPTPPHG